MLHSTRRLRGSGRAEPVTASTQSRVTTATPIRRRSIRRIGLATGSGSGSEPGDDLAQLDTVMPVCGSPPRRPGPR